MAGPEPEELAKLHERLERYTEHREYGFFLAEQDRNNQAQGQPVLIYITEKQLTSTDTSPARRPSRRLPTRPPPRRAQEGGVRDDAADRRATRASAAARNGPASRPARGAAPRRRASDVIV